MEKKVVSLVLVILLLGIASFGCYPKEEIGELGEQIAELGAQVGELEAEIKEKETQISEREAEIAEVEKQLTEKEAQISELETQLAEQPAQIQELEAKIAELEEEIIALEAKNEELMEPAPEISEEVVGRITLEEIRELLREFFPKGITSSGSYTRGPFPLVSLETLEEFLEEDYTNVCPSCYVTTFNICDERAFRLKSHWMEAGLPPHSLGLIKKERMTFEGYRAVFWYNIFITEENGEHVIYEVLPSLNKVKKIEGPIEEICYVVIQDRM